MTLQIRWAATPDDELCRSLDQRVSPDVLGRKIADREILLARRGDECLGYLRLEYLWSKHPFIGLIEVSVDHRAQGVGRALLEFLEDHLREAGHRRLLSSSMADNHYAQLWHRKMGFSECGFLAAVNPDGIGELFFTKQLVAAPGG